MNAHKFPFLAAMTLAASLPAAARADKVDVQLNKEMPAIKKYLDDKGYRNVGVLRFRVQKGLSGAKFDNAPYNGNLPIRIENLLVMHGGPDEAKATQVLHDAGSVASKARVGDWYGDAKERKKLFDVEYPLAWGKKTAKPDAFLTGLVRVSGDLKKTSYTIACFTKDDDKAQVVKQFTLETDTTIIRDLGFSFVMAPKARNNLVAKRSANDVDRNVIDSVAEGEGAGVLGGGDDTKPKDKDKDRPRDDDFIKPTDGEDDIKPMPKPKPGGGGGEEAPKPKPDMMATPSNIAGVEMILLVDGKEHDIRTRGDGPGWGCSCPPPGKTIAFKFRNTTDKRVGVVLKLNGVSTFNQQTAPSDDCQKWVIPAGESRTIPGFMVPEKEVYKPGEKVNLTKLPFKVLVGEDAKDMKLQLGDKAGLIEVDVFAEGKQATTGGEDLQVSARGLPPSKDKAVRTSYKALRPALLKSANLKTETTVAKREIIVPDKDGVQAGGNFTVVEFPGYLVGHLAVKLHPHD